MVIERDRSVELYALFDGIKKSSLPSAAPNNNSGGGGGTLNSSNEVRTFNRFAQAFSKDIGNVSDSIMRLTKLTHRQNVFDDQSTEISGLTQMVKTSLQRLHADLDTLEELKRRALNSQKTTSARSNVFGSSDEVSLRTSQRHTDTVVETLKSRLARTGQEFRSTLQNQSHHMKQNASRRHLFTSADRPQTFESALFQDQEQHAQQQQLVSGTGNVQYYRQRAEAVSEIESAVAEVGELFNDFTRLVHEQDEVILRIDADVDQALNNVNAGSNELMRYLGNLSSNRGLILKVFAMLFFFLMFFGLVVVR